MKKLIAAAALASVLVSPAFAQSYDPSVGSGNLAPQINTQAFRSQARATLQGALGAYAQVHRGTPVHVIRRGDPDPNIQLQLQRESLQGRW